MTKWYFCTAMVALVFSASASAENLYRPGNWASLAADRRAEQVDDIITIYVLENRSASQTAENASEKSSDLKGNVSLGTRVNETAGLGLGGEYGGSGRTLRSGKMVAQLSVVVDTIFPNGDLGIRGAQSLKINGEDTKILLSGRVRPEDIAPGNIVVSSRIANAMIEYDGKGFASDSAKPGFITKMFRFLGLM